MPKVALFLLYFRLINIFISIFDIVILLQMFLSNYVIQQLFYSFTILYFFIIFFTMEAQIKLNGSQTSKGNYVWGAALTLAWKNLSDQIIHQPINLQTDNKRILQIANNFNRSPCGLKMLSENCYYARAGFGNKTVKLINDEVSKKFPNKTTAKIEQNLREDSIISYAYFFKNLQFQIPFEKKNVQFLGKSVAGFCAKTPEMKRQINVFQYKDNDNFMIELRTNKKDDHIIIYKTSKQMTAEQAIEHANSLKHIKNDVGFDDTFQMPKISLKHRRDVQQLLGVYLANEKFKQYFFASIFEDIRIDIDESGIKVQNQGVIKMLKSCIPHVKRRFVVDKPFWIIMRERDNHPYLVAHIVELVDSK